MTDKTTSTPVKMRHRVPVQLRFNDIDMLGHVNNSVYLQFMDLAKYRYITELLGNSFDTTRECMVVANINCNFFAPTFLDESLEVLTATEKIGEHTVHLIQQVVNVDTHQLKAEARTVMVAYNAATASSIAILPEWRMAIEEYESEEL